MLKKNKIIADQDKLINYQRNRLQKLESNLKKLACGNLDFDLEVPETDGVSGADREQFCSLNRHLLKIRDVIDEFFRDTGDWASGIKKGEIDCRLDTSGQNFLLSKVGAEINSSLEAILKPLYEADTVLEKMEQNDFTLKMKGNYNGRLLGFSERMNALTNRLLSVQDVFVRLSSGDLSRLDEFLKTGKRSENDRLMPAAVGVMQSIKSMLEEVEKITREVTKGNVRSARGDSEGFPGCYRDIVVSLNKMLDIVTKPIDEAGAILERMALHDFTMEMEGRYQGELLKFSDSISALNGQLFNIQQIFIGVSYGDTSKLEELKNMGKLCENDKILPAAVDMMETIRSLITETKKLAHAVAEGDLNTWSDTEKFKGEYRNVIGSMNDIVTSVAKPLQEIKEVMLLMSQGHLDVSVKGSYKGDYAVLTDSVNTTAAVLNQVVHEIGDITAKIAQKNLDIENVRAYKGDFGKISESFNEILASLNQTLGEINSAAEQVAAGADQISISSQTLSRGAEEQASSIEEINAAITEMSVKVKQNATDANQADMLSLAAKESAIKGNEQMDEMLRAMREINESSANISKIIKVIDDIAFQTNILALNAAVEAARAGQHGKGFAVVAEEVRSLAQRSASAAEETTVLIEGSVKKVEAGTVIAANTAGALNGIVESIAKATGLVNEISSVSKEQANAIMQVNQAVDQVSQVIQTSSATAEEGASASEELFSQAELLKMMINHFKLRKARETGLVGSNVMIRPSIRLSDNEFGKY